MIALTLADVAAACGGRLAAGDPAAVARAVSVDSRAIGGGDLFVAIKGERFDGDAFAADAIVAGAVAAIVSGAGEAMLPTTAPRIVVESGLAALQALAAAVRRRGSARVVAITGSTGKTSTKDILAGLLRPVARTVATRGNFNNEIGLPVTLLAIDEDTEMVVAELAMRGRGQIRELARIAAPDVGVITNVAPVHLELVGDLDQVAAAKAELIEEIDGNAVVVPGNEPLLAPFISRHRGRVVTFGGAGSDVRLVEAHVEAATTRAVIEALGQRAELRFNFTGEHYLTDALAGLAAFVELGYPLAAAAEGAGSIVFSELRGEVVALAAGGILLNDAYNANPLAVKAAVDHLVALAAGRPAVAVLGDMYELGPDAGRYHAEVGAYVAQRRVGLVAVGDLARGYLDGAGAGSWYATVDECVAALPSEIRPGSAVLVKASRALRLERVAEALKAAGNAGGADAPAVGSWHD